MKMRFLPASVLALTFSIIGSGVAVADLLPATSGATFSGTTSSGSTTTVSSQDWQRYNDVYKQVLAANSQLRSQSSQLEFLFEMVAKFGLGSHWLGDLMNCSKDFEQKITSAILAKDPTLTKVVGAINTIQENATAKQIAALANASKAVTSGSSGSSALR